MWPTWTYVVYAFYINGLFRFLSPITAEASNLKIYRKTVAVSFNIVTGNDVISNFRLATNRISVSILISQLLDNRSTNLEKIDNFGYGDSRASFLAVHIIRHFAPSSRKLVQIGPTVVASTDTPQ